MKNYVINRDNFHLRTKALFLKCNKPEKEPDFVSFKKILIKEDYIEFDTDDCIGIYRDNEYQLLNLSRRSDYITKFENEDHNMYDCLIFKKSNPNLKKAKYGYILSTKEISSLYYYTRVGVIRYSDHWGIVGDCQWNVPPDTYWEDMPIYAFCRWDGFIKYNKEDPFGIDWTPYAHNRFRQKRRWIIPR